MSAAAPTDAAEATLGYTFRGDAGGRTGLFRPAAGNLSLEVGGQTRVRVNPAGRVGINTSVPQARLHVNGDVLCSDAGQVFGSSGATASRPSFAWEGDANTGVFRAAEDEIGVSTGGTERLRLDSQGRVGVNVSAPEERLDVQGAVQASGQIKGAASSTAADPSYTWTGDPDTGMFRADANEIGFGTGGTERVRIDASGNVGVGTADPASALHVTGDTTHHGKIVVMDGRGGGVDRGIRLWTADDPAWGIYMAESGGASTAGSVAVDGYAFDGMATRFRVGDGSVHGVVFENSAEERLLSIRGSDGLAWVRGNLLAAGDVGVKLADGVAPSYALDVAGGARFTEDLRVLTDFATHAGAVRKPGVRSMGVASQTSGASAGDMVWLLCRHGTAGANEVLGDLFGSRGDGGECQLSKVAIHVSTSDVTDAPVRAFVKTSQGSQQQQQAGEGWSLVTCDYGGVTYVALRYVGASTVTPFSFLYFTGVATSEGPEDAFRSLPTSDVANVTALSNADTLETVQAERMGVNVATPRDTLDVDGSVRVSQQVKGSAAASADVPSYAWAGDEDTGMFRAAENAIGFGTAGTERVRVDASGQVGVNVANPQARLDVDGGIRLTEQVEGAPDTASAPTYTWKDDADTGVFRPSADALGLSTGGQQRMVVTDAGNVGVNVDPPEERLHVKGTARATTVLSGRLVLTPGAR